MNPRDILILSVMLLSACGSDDVTPPTCEPDCDIRIADTTEDTHTRTQDTELTPDTLGPDLPPSPDTQPADTSTPDTWEPEPQDTTGPDDTSDPCPEGTVCTQGAEKGICQGGACTLSCGDGLLQPSTGETCDDKNQISGDGCRNDCMLEEPIGAGFTGGQCQEDADCLPAGSTCIDDVGGGSCAIPCTEFCTDQPGSPVTFCIDAKDYEKGLDQALPAPLEPALCVAKCDFEKFPRTGCRAGLHCELHNRHNQNVEDEVCVPGSWTLGLSLSEDGSKVLGKDPQGPGLAEPYAKMLKLKCGGSFEPVGAELFHALATTLLAMGPDGRTNNWERLCKAPQNLPTIYNLHDEVKSRQAFRLTGSRTEIVSWTAAGAYGGKAARGTLIGGPLYPVRTMVYAGNGYYLYADGADDHPHPDPERGHIFGMINGNEWAPMDAYIEPGIDYVVIKANGGGRFYRGWGRLEMVEYVVDMSLDVFSEHGEILGIGDLSLPTGGDIDDHASHELGRDVDLYLVTHDPEIGGKKLGETPWLWVSECNFSGGWNCGYWENATGASENLADPNHTPAKALLTTLAWFAYDFEGPSWFVQHDVSTLKPFIDLPGSSPVFVHAGNDDTLGWPPHLNHIHIRFDL